MDIYFKIFNKNKKLWNYCEIGKLNKIKNLINRYKNRIDINWQNPKDCGSTPLIIACKKGHYSIVHYLFNYLKPDKIDQLKNDEYSENIELELDLYLRDNNGASALLVACLNGHIDIADLIISKRVGKALIGTPDKYDATPLHWAAYYGEIELAKALISASFNEKIIATVMKKAKREYIEKMSVDELNIDIDDDDKKISDKKYIDEKIIDLHKEIIIHEKKEFINKNNEKINELNDEKKDINENKIDKAESKDIELNTNDNDFNQSDINTNDINVSDLNTNDLKLDFENNQYESRYDRFGADVNAEGCTLYCGNTPLIAACKHGTADMVDLLITNGAIVNHQANHDNSTPLIYACASGSSKMVKILLKAGADVNLSGCKNEIVGFSPLHAAVLKGHIHICELLLENGAKVDVVDHLGYKPWNIANSSGNLPLRELIEDWEDEN